jgi:hypothetical protein
VVKKKEMLFAQLALSCDTITLVLSYLVAYVVRDAILKPGYGAPPSYDLYPWVL